LFQTNEAALPLTVLPGRVLTATFDAARQAPSCGDRLFGIACDSAALVVSRSAAGREPNTPNTIDATCVDGATPPASGRWTGVDRIRVYTTAGGLLTAGATARIEATVYASATPAQDAVDFYYTADAASPVWTRLATVVPTAAGTQTLSVPHRLPAGALQAVRVQYRPQGTTSLACVPSPTADRDDLVFAVENP
jgi:bacterial leucyl aminopeptidase